MRTVHREARQKLQQSQRRQKGDYDLCLEERKYSVCDAVYRYNGSIVLGQNKKLQPIWSSPWIVTHVISSVLYRILIVSDLWLHIIIPCRYIVTVTYLYGY